MTERLIIRNFAGLDEIDIELGSINIFIGPQASGKSVCAKCLYWVKSFVGELFASVRKDETKQKFDEAFLARFKELFPSIWRSDKGLLVRYELLGWFVQVENVAGKLKLTYDKRFATPIATARQEKLQFINRLTGGPAIGPAVGPMAGPALGPGMDWFEQLAWTPPALDALESFFYGQMGPTYQARQLFIVAGRSFFMALKANIISFLGSTGPIADPLLRRFMEQYEQARRFQPLEKAANTRVLALAHQILKGKVEVANGDDYVVAANGRRVTLADASSGQQEAFPLLVILLNLVSFDDALEDEARVVYIEEPEAHLFSESQRVLAQFMAQVYHQSPVFLQYVITTHSPYLLASFNNLVYAHQLAQVLHDQHDQLKKLHQIVPKSQQLPLANFRAYGFEKNTARPLVDQEVGLLTADLLDYASDVTGEQFSNLMALDPSTHPE